MGVIEIRARAGKSRVRISAQNNFFFPELPVRLWYPPSLLLNGSRGVSWDSSGQGPGFNAVPVLMKPVVGEKWHRYRVFSF